MKERVTQFLEGINYDFQLNYYYLMRKGMKKRHRERHLYIFFFKIFNFAVLVDIQWRSVSHVWQVWENQGKFEIKGE